MTPALGRHQLAFLTAEGWAEVLRRPLAVDVADALQHWADRDLPLVVTQQGSTPGPRSEVALGWPAPRASVRRRLALRVRGDAIARRGEFPLAAEVLERLPDAGRGPMRSLLGRLDDLDTPARVYGSFGWERLTGLAYVHARSDLDLWLAVRDRAQADRVVAVLATADAGLPRLDGELVGPGGDAVAWREFASWRAGATRSVLVKRLEGAAIQSRLDWPLGASAVAA